jgi:hypothetical protein
MKKLFLVLPIVLVLLATSFVFASANEPTIVRYTLTPELTLSGVCAFDITLHPTVQVTEIDYVNGSGDLTRVYIHGTEQDTFTGTGGSLTTAPYSYNLELRFDSSGAFTAFFASGLVLRVQLPDGSWFVSAGRINVLAHPGITFSATPDFGHSGNLAAFCAALS